MKNIVRLLIADLAKSHCSLNLSIKRRRKMVFKVLFSCTEYSIILDIDEVRLDEAMICLDEQYPITMSYVQDANKDKARLND